MATELKDEPLKTMAAVDCTQEQATCQAAGVRGYPTVIAFGGKDGPSTETKYQGSRTADDVAEFLNTLTK